MVKNQCDVDLPESEPPVACRGSPSGELEVPMPIVTGAAGLSSGQPPAMSQALHLTVAALVAVAAFDRKEPYG